MKSKPIQARQEKTFALLFDAGEEVVAGLLQFAKDHKLSGAHLTAIGAFERLTLGFFDVTKKDYERTFSRDLSQQDAPQLRSQALDQRASSTPSSSSLLWFMNCTSGEADAAP